MLYYSYTLISNMRPQMRISKENAKKQVADYYCRDFTQEQRRTIDLDGSEIINWLWQLQRKYPELGVPFGGDLHQIRRELLEKYSGPYV